MIIAELRAAKKKYGPVTALDDVNLEIERGQLLALLGRNGAGKTTATRVLLGLITPDGGQARIFGRDPRERAARTKVGAMLQTGKVPDALRVAEHIELFSSYYPDPLPSGEILRAAGLEGLQRRPFGKLSGGQKQRVLFALAICGRPGLLVLDEPTAGLDVESRRGLWEHIRRFVNGGGSVLLTTHYLEEADVLADRVVVIDRGRVTAAGTPAEIKRSCGAKQIRCVTTLALGQLRALEGVSAAEVASGRARIETPDSDGVLARLMAADPKVREIEVRGAALEEAFLALTAGREEAQ